jgi:hypothetical protein
MLPTNIFYYYLYISCDCFYHIDGEKDLKIEKAQQFFFFIKYSNTKFYENPLCGSRIVSCIHMDGLRELMGTQQKICICLKPGTVAKIQENSNELLDILRDVH